MASDIKEIVDIKEIDEPGQKTGLDFFEIAGKHEFDSCGKLILQPYRDWCNYNDDECPYRDITQEELCSLWYAKNQYMEISA